jgi:hypothetical protein
MGSILRYLRFGGRVAMQPWGFRGVAEWPQPTNDPPKICQASRDFATRLSTR